MLLTAACPRCGHPNRLDARVCDQCATPLVKLCAQCGFEGPDGFKFCGNCGAAFVQLGAASLSGARSPAAGAASDTVVAHIGKATEGERRTVTILFTDVVGFTTLSERLDPEQVYNIIGQVQQAFLAAIKRHEGWFDKFLGDGLMAIFGAPVAHEDDPPRAVRAALDMQRALRQINEELDPRLNVTLRLRMGLNAGPVVVSAMDTSMGFNYTPLGDAVNVASRLQTIAEPGSIVVSRAVYEPVKALFDFTELGSIRVRNRVEPVEIFQVAGVKRLPGQTRGIPGFQAPMVGRDAEYARLQAFAGERNARRDRGFVVVAGEAGIGKSRLTAEFRRTIEPSAARMLESASLAYGQSAYALFVALLRGLFDVGAEDRDAAQRITDYVATALDGVAPPSEVTPFILHLLSIGETATVIRYLEPAQLRQQTFLAVRDLLVAEARRQPLVLIFEDLHWIDDLSADLLLYLIRTTADAPLLFYCTSRLDAANASLSKLDKAGQSLPPGAYLRLDLQRLTPGDTDTLLGHLLRVAAPSDSLKELATHRAEGNPLYIEEILRALIDGGALRENEGRWETSPGLSLSALEVPRTLQGLLMARVDSLPEETRYLMQHAAVIGRTFPRALLQRVLEASDPGFESELRLLRDHDLIALTAQSGSAEYIFRHVLIQETVYASLLQRRRQRMHFQTATAIEALYADRIDEYAEPLAYQYTEAGDNARALPYLIRSAERAAGRYANDEAMRRYHAVVELLPATPVTPAQRVAAYTGMGEVQLVVGRYDDALQSFRNAIEIARGAGGSTARQIASIASRIGRVFMRKSNYDESLRWQETALDELDRDPDSLRSVERMRIYHEMGWVYYQRGEMDKAYQWRMRSLEIGSGTDYYAELGAAYNGLVPLFAARGDWDRARSYAVEGLRMRERISDTEGTARCYVNLANISVAQGDWNRAVEDYGRGLTLALRVGQASTTFTIYHNLGELHTLKGESAVARGYLAQARSVAESSGNVHQLCAALNNTAEVDLLEGRPAAAIETLQGSLARARETGNKPDQAQAHWLMALAQLAGANLPEAEAAAAQALTIASDAKLAPYEGRAARALGSVRRAQGRLDEARELLQRARGIFVTLKDRLEMARTDLEIASLCRASGDAAAQAESARGAEAVFVSLGAEVDRQRAAALVPQPA
ncbi:MAG: tetratricopeptide repeat protein [Chloroflexi bacterium]|nr:tetratricopeptide repeat protein [Chloroflexota bacterium]